MSLSENSFHVECNSASLSPTNGKNSSSVEHFKGKNLHSPVTVKQEVVRSPRQSPKVHAQQSCPPKLMTTRKVKSNHFPERNNIVAEYKLEVTVNELENNLKERKFQCNICPVTVDSLKKLKNHKRIHLQRFYCSVCFREFLSKHEHGFHEAVCQARNEVKLAESEKSKEFLIPRRCTIRTRSRAITATSLVPINTEKGKEIVKEKQIPTTKESSRVCKIEPPDENIAGKTETSKWEDESVKSLQPLAKSYKAPLSKYNSEFRERLNWQITNDKEYDLYLLDCFKKQVLAKSFTCFEPKCRFETDTILNIMLHDYIHHFKSAWFFCKKCGNCFTSKVFLDYHLHRQNRGHYLCFKCGKFFSYQYDLDCHLMQHNRYPKYRCDYCQRDYLTVEELNEHCTVERHKPNEQRPSIIDRELSMITTDDVKDTPAPTRANVKYEVKILDMKLPKIPSKMPKSLDVMHPHMPQHLRHPYRRYKIGQMEFKNQVEPNCSANWW
uniref:C2H2-type domain-containing protein n=1 Tax=Glossina austeni TaxID=7395 RepID=A0A1A9UF65_GLOAU